MLRAIKPFTTKAPRLYSVRWLEHNLDTLTSRIVRHNELVCFNFGCDETEGLQCGHLIERRHRPTRWDIHPEGCCHTQCAPCNAKHESHPKLYQDSYIEQFGEKCYFDLVARAHARDKVTYSDLLAMYEDHKQKLNSLKGKAAA